VASRDDRRLEKGSTKDRARLTTALAVGALVAIFAVLNLDEVDVNWIVGTWSTPLIVVIVLSLALGAGAGYFVGRRRARRQG
jgi:lipopolysaccharide assembly protein A